MCGIRLKNNGICGEFDIPHVITEPVTCCRRVLPATCNAIVAVYPDVAELADAPASSTGTERCMSSSLMVRTNDVYC